MKKTLQVFMDNKWQYVFCRNQLQARVVTTANQSKAIHGDSESLKYFERFFPQYQFRITTEKPQLAGRS